MIERGKLEIRNVKKGDALDIDFEVEGYDFAGKELAMDIKVGANGDPLVRFSSEANPPTIFAAIDPVSGEWVITLFQTSLEMKKLNPGRYVFDIETYTTDEDTETIIDGTIEIVAEITEREK